MRFEDWDVLLFPSGTHDQHVPLKEYRVECHAVADERLDADGRPTITTSNSAAPLMTSFVPSLEHGAPFQISVHSWMPTRFYYHPQPGSHQPDHVQMWQIKVIVDGVTQCIENFTGDVKWPKAIAIANMEPPINKSTPQPMHFPQFHEHVMTDTNWSPHDTVGRIKIEISEGYAQVRPDDLATIGPFRYYKLLNHAFFNFQPAPFKILQRTGIAYPSPTLESHILTLKDRRTNNFVAFPGPVQSATGPNHARNMSASSVNSQQYTSPYMGPGGPPNTPHFAGMLPLAAAWSFGHGTDDEHSATSRSTSAYSTVPLSALPLPAANTATNNNMPPPYPTSGTKRRANRPRADPGQVVLRLPSDQLRDILSALKQPQKAPADTSMPPPPVPQHVLDRRNANASDVSMHNGCTNFPNCTTEDNDGHVFHQPAEVVRGRKEGSANANNRDFFSSIPGILNPQPASSPDKVNSLLSSSPADGTTKKRTRSTLKSLSVNEGSPQKLSKDHEVSNPEPRKVTTPEADKENVPENEDTMSIDI